MIDRVFYNPVENSSRGHPQYPLEISTLWHPLGISIDHPWGRGGGVWIFSGITHSVTDMYITLEKTNS